MSKSGAVKSTDQRGVDSPTRGILLAVIVSMTWPLFAVPVGVAFGELKYGVVAPILLLLPWVMAFPFLYRTRLFDRFRPAARVVMLALAAYGVFGIAFIVWSALLIMLILKLGAIIG